MRAKISSRLSPVIVSPWFLRPITASIGIGARATTARHFSSDVSWCIEVRGLRPSGLLLDSVMTGECYGSAISQEDDSHRP